MADRNGIPGRGDWGGDSGGGAERLPLGAFARRFFLQGEERQLLLSAGDVDCDQCDLIDDCVYHLAVSAIELAFDLDDCEGIGCEVKVEAAGGEMRLLRRGQRGFAI